MADLTKIYVVVDGIRMTLAMARGLDEDNKSVSCTDSGEEEVEQSLTPSQSASSTL